MPDRLIAGPPTATRTARSHASSDRSRPAMIWYRAVQGFFATLLGSFEGLRATGRANIPDSGPLFLVSNHLSHLDVLVLGILLERPLNYGAFPINRDGMGAEGFKETLRRIRAGGIVVLFPEGTRSPDGELGELKAGIARMVQKAKAPIVPAAIAGTFEAWPRSRFCPGLHPLRIHFGPPISVEEVASLNPEAATLLIRDRILSCQAEARASLSLGLEPRWS